MDWTTISAPATAGGTLVLAGTPHGLRPSSEDDSPQIDRADLR